MSITNRENEIFYFYRGSYLGGDLRYWIENINNKFVLKGRASNEFHWMADIEFEIPEEEIDKLIKRLSPVLKWKRKYEVEYGVDDGYGWDIRFNYKNIRIKTGGYEKYPRDYCRVIKSLQRFIERLGAKYNKEYQKDGYKERIKL